MYKLKIKKSYIKLNKLIKLFFVLLLFSSSIYSQILPGKPAMRNISHKEYNAEKQNFSVVQDNRGVMYFANTGSILELDGTSWRQIFIPNNPVVYAMVKDKNGRIYIGTSTGDIGYLSPDSSGLTQYVSLS